VAIFGKTWLLHVTDVLKTTPEENLAIISDSVSFLKQNGREVIFDAEHFFDGFRADRSYALAAVRAAARPARTGSPSAIPTAGTCPRPWLRSCARRRRC